jgi:REP element-mobilizing transposase RayT
MGRALRVEEPNGTYHVCSRGNNRHAIVCDDDDRETWLRILAYVTREYGWTALAYCLMTNQYHLLIQLPEDGGLSDGMRLLNGLYSRVTSKKYGRSGHLFHKRFRATQIETNEHRLTVAAYIVLNPVRAGICALPREWRWSSYRASAGLVTPPNFLAVRKLLSLFGDDREPAAGAYRRFVESLVSDTNTKA